MVGAGYAWIIANLLPFVAWLPVVHRRFIKGLHTRWLLIDVLPIALLPAAIGLGLQQLAVWPASRLLVAFGLVATGALLTIAAAVGSSWARETIGSRWRHSAAA